MGSSTSKYHGGVEAREIKPNVLLAGGGTAGHINPLIAVADELRRRRPEGKLLAIGTESGLEKRLIPSAGIDLVEIPKVPFPRRPSADMLRFPHRLRSAIRAAESAIEKIDADVVVGFGGYVATPAYLAARNKEVPIVVHEANARPGLANKLGARYAEHVAVTFPDTKLRSATLTGLPLRRQISQLDRKAERSRARTELGIPQDVPLLLVTGGSLGAARLNERVEDAAPQLAANEIHILHLTGNNKSAGISAAAGSQTHHVVEYLDDMALAYAASDLVLCRSGAGSVSEISAIGLPAIYIPLPIGNGEQRLNAQAVVDAGGALMMADNDLTSQWIVNTVTDLVRDRDRLTTMSEIADRFGHRDATTKVVEMVEDAARSKGE